MHLPRKCTDIASLAMIRYERAVLFVPHGWNTAVGLAADLQLVAAVPVARWVEYITPAPYIEDLVSGKVLITSQNHGFAVADPDAGMLAAHPSGATSPDTENLHGQEVKVRYINANDRTVEGLDVVDKPCFTIQFHPEACPGPHDADSLFVRFREIVDSHLGVL